MSPQSKNQLVLGLCIFLGLSVLGLSIAASPDNFRRHDRGVSVKGLAERIVPADRAIWPITFTATSNEIEGLYVTLDSDREIVQRFLYENDFAPEEITANPPLINDKLAANYGNKAVNVRFTGQQTLSVYTDRVDLVRSTMARMTELGKSGIILGGARYGEQPDFLFTGLNEIKPSMIEEATRNAREVALKFARDSESRLGKIRSARQGQFSITNRDQNTPHLKKVRVVSTIDYFLID